MEPFFKNENIEVLINAWLNYTLHTFVCISWTCLKQKETHTIYDFQCLQNFKNGTSDFANVVLQENVMLL